MTAVRNGFRDWNAFCATVGNRPPEAWMPGGRVKGQYLSQPFQATVVASKMLRPGWFRLELELDEPVDVVHFESFSNHRRRIICRGGTGRSFARAHIRSGAAAAAGNVTGEKQPAGLTSDRLIEVGLPALMPGSFDNAFAYAGTGLRTFRSAGPFHFRSAQSSPILRPG